MARFLLIHGSCHGAWCWSRLIPELEARGHEARAIDLPGAGADPRPASEVTLGDYAGAIRAALDAALREDPEPLILLGHSMGGFPVTAAAEADPSGIRALVYLCAYRPSGGVSLADMRRAGPRQPLQGALEVAGGAFLFRADRAAELLAQDCPAELQAWQISRLTPQAITPQEEALTVTARSAGLPQYYIACEKDQTIPPEYQLTMAAGLPEGHLRRLAASHSPFLSMPDRLAEELSQIARDLEATGMTEPDRAGARI